MGRGGSCQARSPANESSDYAELIINKNKINRFQVLKINTLLKGEDK